MSVFDWYWYSKSIINKTYNPLVSYLSKLILKDLMLSRASPVQFYLHLNSCLKIEIKVNHELAAWVGFEPTEMLESNSSALPLGYQAISKGYRRRTF